MSGRKPKTKIDYEPSNYMCPDETEIVVNGKLYRIRNPETDLLLSTYLREKLHLTGVRVCCGEGGCGSCTVLAHLGDGWKPIHSCLRLIISCHTLHIITVEGLEKSSHLSSLPLALAKGNGVQCGFCSPGFVMSSIGYLLQTNKARKFQTSDIHQEHESYQETAVKLQKYVDGHICRCTGYRPILSSLSMEIIKQKSQLRKCDKINHEHLLDIEDSHSALLCVSNCGKGSDTMSSKNSSSCETSNSYGSKNKLNTRDNYNIFSHSIFQKNNHNRSYYQPSTLSEAISIYQSLRKYANQFSPIKIKFIAANTSPGVTKYLNNNFLQPNEKRIIIDLNRVSDLKAFSTIPSTDNNVFESNELSIETTFTKSITVKSLVTISKLTELLIQNSDNNDHMKDASWLEAGIHMEKIGNTQIRNAGTWAGNIMIALQYTNFSSDLILLFIGLDAKISYIDLNTGKLFENELFESFYNFFLRGVPESKAQIKNIFLVSITFEKKNSSLTDLIDEDLNITQKSVHRNNMLSSSSSPCTHVLVSKSFRVSPRSSNSFAHVALFFIARLSLDQMQRKQNFFQCADINIIINLSTCATLRAKECEIAFFEGGTMKELWKKCLKGLDNDFSHAKLIEDVNESCTLMYKKSVARSLLFKSFIQLCLKSKKFFNPPGEIKLPHNVNNPLCGLTPMKRVIESCYKFSIDESTFPVSYPVPKIDAHALASGKAKYIIDFKLPVDGLHGSLIISKICNVTFRSLDNSASSFPGVIQIFTADDIPHKNSILTDPLTMKENEHLFVKPGDKIPYVGACLGVVIAKSDNEAIHASKNVKVNYEPCATHFPGIYSLEAAMDTKSFFDDCIIEPIARGNVQQALAKAPKRLSGRLKTGGQKHFYLENQNTVVVPTGEGSYEVHSATQAVSDTQTILSNVLGVTANRINVSMKRIGGAFGGKFTRSLHCAAAACVAAAALNKPIHIKNDRETDFAMVGGREPVIFEYDAGFDDNGKLLALTLRIHMDSGSAIDFSKDNLELAMLSSDHCYFIPNFRVEGFLYKTNLPVNTACRAPGSVQSCYAIDVILSKIADTCGITMHQCQKLNFYQKGQHVLTGDILQGTNLQNVWNTLWTRANINRIQEDITTFNSQHKWIKRGLGITPCKYGVVGSWFKEIAKVSVFATDGSIEVTHSGVEMGQGIDTKVAQVAAYCMGIPIKHISIGKRSSNLQPNTFGTAASATSEICCDATMKACLQINKRLEPYKKKVLLAAKRELTELNSFDIFIRTIREANNDRICLSAEGWSAPQLSSKYQYYVFCAAAIEVELDILTGETQILRIDVVYDCGNQLNAHVDIGQIEGGLVMGLGYFLSEDVKHNKANGHLVTKNTWQYKPFVASDIPRKFKIYLLENTPNSAHGSVLRSKATGEPPLVCSSAVIFALKEAITSARKELECTNNFDFDIPLTVEKRHLACGIKDHHLNI